MDLVFTDNVSNVYMLWREMSEVENIGEFGEFIQIFPTEFHKSVNLISHDPVNLMHGSF